MAAFPITRQILPFLPIIHYMPVLYSVFLIRDAVTGTGGGFGYCELGERLLLEDGNLNPVMGKETTFSSHNTLYACLIFCFSDKSAKNRLKSLMTVF